MLNRKELKARGKAAFKNNYWACVIVGLLLAMTVGLMSSIEFETQYTYVGGVEYTSTHMTILGITLSNSFLFSAALGSLIVLLINVLVSSVIEVGGCSFFGKNAFQQADIKEVFFGFDKNCYKNIVIVQLMRDVKIFLWSLLFIIPGIVKSYEYYMIPYILADNPNMEMKDVFALSKKMMNGHKMEVFVFELSFFFWNVLAIFTFGILSIFYVNPYVRASTAEIYHALKYQNMQVYENTNENVEYTQTSENMNESSQ